MQLAKKKMLASKVLNVGKNRIIFVAGHEAEVKEAITRQDILDLKEAGAIQIRGIVGKKKVVKRKNRRRTGKVKKKVKREKKDYVIMTRKLRLFLKHLLKTGKIEKDKYLTARKMIRAKKFRSKRHLNDSLEEI